MADDVMRCSCCGQEAASMSMVILTPCNHHICSPCMIDSTMACRFDHSLRCPCLSCKKKFTSYQHNNTCRSRNVPRKEFIKGYHDIEEYCNELAQLDSDDLVDILASPLLVVAASKISLQDDQESGRLNIRPSRICFFTVEQDGGFLEMKKVLPLFTALHAPLVKFPAEQSEESEEKAITFTPKNLFSHICDSANPLQQSLLALASGQPVNLAAVDFGDPHHQSGLFATQLAADLLRRVKNSGSVGHAIRTLTVAVDNYKPSPLRDLLTRFRVTTGRETQRRQRAKEFVEEGLKVVKWAARSLVILMADNIQWKVKFGANPGTYKHWTAISFMIVPPEVLIADRIIRDDETALSRKRDDWKKDIVDKNTPEKILKDYFLATPADYDELAKLSLLHEVVALRSDDLLDKRQRPAVHRVFTENDLQVLFPASDGSTTMPVAEEASAITSSGDVPSLWKKNHLHPSFAIAKAFGSNEMQVDLMEMGTRIINEATTKFADEKEILSATNESTSNLEPPISEHFFGYAGDGGATVPAFKLKAGDVDGRWSNICPLAGIFHFYMEVFKMANAANEEMVRFLTSLFLGKGDNDATEKNLDYFVKFSDPTLYEKNKGQILLAVYRHVIEAMKRAGHKEVSAVDVRKYMIEMAKTSPILFAVLDAVQWWELSLLVRKAERTNDMDLFFSTIRMAAPLFCVQNCTEYIRLCCDLLVYWTTASELEKAIVKKYGFTLMTANKVNIGIDCAQEKYVNQVRKLTGKIYARGLDSKIEHSAICRLKIVDENNVQNAMDSLKQEPEEGIEGNETNPIPVAQTGNLRYNDTNDDVFSKVFKKLEDIGLFDADDSGRKAYESSTDQLFSLRTTGAVCSSRSLEKDSIGTGRYCEYVIELYIKTQGCAERGKAKTGIDLTAFNGTAKKETIKREILIKLATSLNSKDLKDTRDITRELLGKQLEMLSQHAASLNIVSPKWNVTSNSKTSLVNKLLSVRKAAYKQNPNLSGIIKKETLEVLGGNTTIESRTNQLKRPFWSNDGSPSMSATFANKKFKINPVKY